MSRTRSRSAQRAVVDAPAVAQDGDVVAHPEDLVEPVRDVDDGDALVAQEVDDREEPLHLARLERRGGLVHDDDAMALVHGAGHGHGLLDADAELLERAAHVDVDAVAGQDVACLAMHAPLVDEPEAVRGLVAQEEVLGRAHRAAPG